LPTISCGIICDDHKMLGLENSEKHLKIYTKLEFNRMLSLIILTVHTASAQV
jgi:hypothetical protein